MWYVDSDANNHVTGDPNILQSKQVYAGKDNLMIGNGETMSIKHIDKANIDAPSSQKLALHRVLHMSKINKNLLSISQLTSSNNV